jgi:hypothetical protein
VAQIVGARTQRPAVTFSAPGVVLSRRKFNIELHDINNYLVNVRNQTSHALSGYHYSGEAGSHCACGAFYFTPDLVWCRCDGFADCAAG